MYASDRMADIHVEQNEFYIKLHVPMAKYIIVLHKLYCTITPSIYSFLFMELCYTYGIYYDNEKGIFLLIVAFTSN